MMRFERGVRAYLAVCAVIVSMLLVAVTAESGGLIFIDSFERFTNKPPVAEAGTDQVVYGGGPFPVLLIGERSEDVDGTITATWEQIAGIPAVMGDPSGLNQAYFPPRVESEQELVFRLTITDDDGLSDFDMIKVRVLPAVIEATVERRRPTQTVPTPKIRLFDAQGQSLGSAQGNLAKVTSNAGANVLYAVATADSQLDMKLSVVGPNGLSLETAFQATDFVERAFLTPSDFQTNPADLLTFGHVPPPSAVPFRKHEHPQIIEIALPHPDPGLRDPDRFLAFLNHTSIRFQEDAASAEAYYRAVDPNNERLTLNDWLDKTGFAANGADAHASYQNDADLGFARDMYMRKNVDGTVAGYVRNFPSLEYLQLDEKLIATVAMEYGPSTGHPENYTKFFVFGPDGERLLAADLDGRGAKFVPGVCNVCHGGTPKPTTISEDGVVTYPDQGDTGAQFLPWDVDTFKFSDRPGYTLEDQEEDFYDLNQVARAAWPADPSTVTGMKWTASAAVELLEGWYAGGDKTFDGSFVPVGWTGSAEQRELYLEVVGPNCRACHVTRGYQQQNAIDFSTYEKFMAYAPLIRELVYDQGVMPLASRTFGHFWSGGADSPAAKLARVLPPRYNLMLSTGEPVTPGRPIARTGMLTDGTAQVADVQLTDDGTLLDGRNSLFAPEQDWRVVSLSLTPEPVERFGDQAISQAVPGDDGEFILSRQIAPPASVHKTTFKRADLDEPNFFFDIFPLLNSCTGCHKAPEDGGIPGIPVWFENDDILITYREVLDRINFEQPDQSLFLTKPGGLRHGYNANKAGVFDNAFGNWEFFDVLGEVRLFQNRGINAQAVSNWIAAGAPFWGSSSSGKSWTCQNVGLPIPEREVGDLQDLVLAGPNQIIKDLQVELNLVGPAFLDFLSISLTHVDSGQTFKLIDRPTDDGSGTCSRLDIVEGRVWDAAPQTSLCDSTPNSPVSFRPVDPLGALDGLPLNSLWKLSIENFVALRENGSLGYWCVKNMRVP